MLRIDINLYTVMITDYHSKYGALMKRKMVRIVVQVPLALRAKLDDERLQGISASGYIRRARPKERRIRIEAPDLRIISHDLWESVGTRLARMKDPDATTPVPIGKKRVEYLSKRHDG